MLCAGLISADGAGVTVRKTRPASWATVPDQMKMWEETDMSRRLKPMVFSSVSFAAVLLGATAAPAATTCEGLASLSLPHGQITAAQTITGGTFNTPPGCTTGATGCTTNISLPQFCRVAGTATPTNDSIINFEVW